MTATPAEGRGDISVPQRESGPHTPQDAGIVPAARWPHALLMLSFGVLLVASALSRSAVPVVLGRYSRALFACQVAHVAALVLLVVPAQTARTSGTLLAVLSTFLAPLNEALRHTPGLLVLLPLIRLLAGLTLAAHEFDRFRTRQRPARGVFVGLGAVLVVLSVADLGLWAVVRTRPDFGEDFAGFRDRYDLAGVSHDDVVLVGDSFVWGHGVAKDERFGNVLERLYAEERRPVRVFSLGVRGAGPDEYLSALAQLPAGADAGVIVFSFYPNDLPRRPRPPVRGLRTAQGVAWTLGRSSLSCRAVHDLLGKLETPSVAAYHRSVIADYDRADPTFSARWAELVAALDRLAQRARERSASPPLLLIIPLMIDFHDYPLAQAHADLSTAARGLGYEVLDLLPAFRTALGDGNRYRVSRQDNHFDAATHARVAALLKERLDRLPATARLGRAR